MSNIDLEKARKYIQLMNLKDIVDRFTTPDTRNKNIINIWSKAKADYVVDQYKNFLYLKLKYPNIELNPSTDIDEIWHCHILDTKRYYVDTMAIFGYFLHHSPDYNINEPEYWSRLAESWNNTQELYLKEFGEYIYEYEE